MKNLLFYVAGVLVLFCMNNTTLQAQKTVIPKHIKIKKVDWRGGELAFHVDDVIQLVRFFQQKDGVKECSSDVSTGNLKITGHQGTKLQKLLLNATIVAQLNDMGYNLEVNGEPIILQTQDPLLVKFKEEDCLDCEEVIEFNKDVIKDITNGFSDEGNSEMNFDFGDVSNANDLDNLGSDAMLMTDSSLNLDSLKNAINAGNLGNDNVNNTTNTLPDMQLLSTPPQPELNLDSLKRAINNSNLKDLETKLNEEEEEKKEK